MRLLLLVFILCGTSHAATLQGRVVTTNGKPVAQAQVNLDISIAVKDDFEEVPRRIRTNDDGRFALVFSGAIESTRVRSVKAKGFVQRTAPQGEEKNGKWIYPDILMAAQNKRVSGQVFDSKDQPIDGALVVAPEAINTQPVITDAQGNFVLQNVPEDESVIFAAHEKTFAAGKIKSSSKTLNLTLLPPRVLVEPMNVQLQQQMRLTLSQTYLYWDAIGTEKMLVSALQKDGALPYGESDLSKTNWLKASAGTLSFLNTAEWNDSSWLRSQGADLLNKIPPQEKTSQFWLEAQIAAAQSLGDENQRAAARLWLEKALAQTPSWAKPTDAVREHSTNVSRFIRMAGVAGALGDMRSKELVQTAGELLKKSQVKSLQNYGSSWGLYLAYGGPEIFDELPSEWDFSDRNWMLTWAIKRMATINLKRARALHEKLKSIEHSAEYKDYRKQKKRNTDEANQLSSQTQSMLIQARALHDPAGALQEAEEKPQKINETVYLDDVDLLVIARAAWRQNNSEVFTRVAKWFLSAAPVYSASHERKYSYMAALSRKIAPSMENEFWKKAEADLSELEKAESSATKDKSYWRDMYVNLLADYIFYRAPFDTARQRLRLETEWHNKRIQQEFDPVSDLQLHNLSSIMVAFDAVRAFELERDIDSQFTQARMGAYILASEPERSVLWPRD